MEKVADLVSRFHSGTVEQKIESLDNIFKKNGPDAVDILIEAFADSKWPVRKHAAGLLAKKGAAVTDALGVAMASENEDVRFWAVKTLVKIGKPSVPLLKRALESGTRHMCCHSATALGDIGDETAIPLLVNALGHEVWSVRSNAYDSLVKFGESSLPSLEKAVDSEDENVLYWSARALGKIGGKSRDILIRALKTGTEQHRFIVAAALAETGDIRIISLLVKNCGEGNWIVRKRSADALSDIGRLAIPSIIEALKESSGKQSSWLIYALSKMGSIGRNALKKLLVSCGENFRWNIKEELTDIGEDFISVLQELAIEEDRNVRFFAVTCLGESVRSAMSDDVLMKALSDPCWSVRKIAANGLATRGLAIMDRLNLALETGDEDIRFWVTYIFRRMGVTGVKYLIDALSDSNSSIAYFAASALGDVHDESVVRPLIRALGNSHWPVRKSAATSLMKLSHLCISTIINFINDENEDIQFWVGKILQEKGSDEIETVITKMKRGSDEERFYGAKALGIIKDPRAVEPLIKALQDGHEWVRLYAAIALGDIGDRRAISHLIEILGEPGFKLSASMIRVFKSFGKAAIPELLSAAENDEDLKTRCGALTLLGHLQAEVAYPIVLAAIESKTEDLRVAAVEAIGHFGERPEVLPALVKALHSSSPKVRSRVIQAFGTIGSESVVEPLLIALHGGHLGHEGKDGILNVLVGFGEDVVPLLIKYLGNEEVGIRKAAAESLTAFGKTILPYVESASKIDCPNVRFWSGRVIKSLRDGNNDWKS
jgi:HEAT repeat protein